MRKSIITVFLVTLVALTALAQNRREADSLIKALKGSKLDTNLINVQINLGSYYLFKPGEFKNDLDSAINFFNQAAQSSNKLHAVLWQYRTLELIGNYYAEAGNLERCKQNFMRAISYYHQTANKFEEAAAWRWLGNVYDNLRKNDHQDERIGYYQNARSLFLQDHRPSYANEVLKNIAQVHIAGKRFDLAENELQQVLAQYKVLGHKQLQDTYNMLYEMELAKGNYYRAMTYDLECIRSMKATRDTINADRYYEGMARCNYAVKQYEEALLWIRKAMIHSNHRFDLQCKVVQILVLLNRTKEAREVLNELTKEQPDDAKKLYRDRAFALYYDKINQDDLAIQYYLKIFSLSDPKSLSQDRPLICNVEIAGVYLKINQPAKAEKYLDNAAFIFKNAKINFDPRFLLGFYSNLYKYNVATGNYEAAVKNLEQRDKLQDSLFTVDKNNKVAELDIKYQTVQKEQSIKGLNNQTAIQRAGLEKANLLKNVTFAGVILLLIIAGLFRRQSKLRKKNNNIITQKNTQLQSLVTEKEWLLKEVHHRVKNNLHSVICLLEAQAAYLENDALQAIASGQHRIYTMSLIHQKLYQSEDIKTIDMAVYIPELIQYLRDSFDDSARICFQLAIDTIKLNPAQAIPLALIINEAITNSIKYAFPGDRRGEITVSLTDNGVGYKLEIADNGIGINKKTATSGKGSLGMELMQGLTKEISGEITIDSSNGVKIIIVFDRDRLHIMDQLQVDYLVSA